MTLAEAYDAIMERFWTDWQALAPAQNGGSLPQVRWQGDDDGALPPTTDAWAMVTIAHGLSGQATLGKVGERMFERTGTVTVQVFTPLSRGQGLTQAQALASIARDAFEGKTAGPNGEIWFRDAAATEVGPDGAWYQMNASAFFIYDELK